MRAWRAFAAAVIAMLLLAAGAWAQDISLNDAMSFPFISELTSARAADRIAWVRIVRGVRNVWVADGPGFVPRQVTRFTEDDGQELTEVTLSPDGSILVFVRGGDHDANWPAKGGLQPNPTSSPVEPKVMLWTADPAGVRPAAPLVEGDAPAVSARGVLAYLRDGKVWTVKLDGTDARRLFFDRGKDGDLIWSPDGGRLAFVSGRDDHSFVGIYTGESQPIAWLAPSTGYDISPAWSPDGTRVAFVRLPGHGGPPEPLLKPIPHPWSIWTADVSTGAGRLAWKSPETLRGSFPDVAGGANLHWAQGGGLTFLATTDNWPHLYVVAETGGEARLLTPGEFMVEDVTLSRDGGTLVYSANTGNGPGDDDRRHLFRVSVGGGAPVQLTSGESLEWGPVALSGSVAFVGADARRPGSVAVADLTAPRPRILDGQSAPPEFAGPRFVVPKQVTFRAPDGLLIHGQLFQREDGAARKPGVIFVHGGPPRQMMLGWSYMRYYSNAYAMNQYLAAHGFVVLSVNYRLGIGYGYDFQHPEHAGPAGSSEYQDVVAGGRFLQQAAGVDPARIGIWGGSYGGLLTALGLARNSDLFKAGVDLHGVHDWPGDVADQLEDLKGRFEQGDRAEALVVAWHASPVADVDHWTSPVLLIHGDDDRNVHFNQTVDLARRLQARGVAYEELVLPDEIHDFLRHASWLKAYAAGAEFLTRSLATPAQRFTGYTDASADREREVEQTLKSLPSPERVRQFHRYLTAEPHPAGSERNNELARYVAEEWKRQGWQDVTIHRYDVYDSVPRQITLEMIEPVRYTAGLREAAYDVDPDTKNPHVSRGYLAMSASGEVTAPLVYARGGNPEDYELLEKSGIDVRGKVVIVRYSDPYSYRGFKALTAERRGAAALLIYSDPAEDGFKKGPVFPDGPWGPETHLQRGAITYDFIVPGDPLTPGWASTKGARRIKPEDALSVPKIMAAVLSWHDAKPLLEQMDGPEAPKDWQGGLPITYRLGGGRVKVHLKVDMDNAVKPYYVVEARLRGTELPDEWVLLGNHRDAWEFGGVDPSSGTASMLELTRALGEMAKKGIHPRRSIIACSWDGEEVGLTGSTEWGEQFAPDLSRKLVAYINVDSSASGPAFQASAVGSLAPLLVEVSRSLDDPSGTSLYEAWKKSAAGDTARFAATGGGERKAAVDDDSLVDTRIGSGSDHTVFLNALGRPVVGLTFDGPYGVYHSVYDDYYWINHFGDPGYRYHTLMSRFWGVLALRLANADVLPFDFGFYGRDIGTFLHELCGAGDPAHAAAGRTTEGCRAGELDLGPAIAAAAEFAGAGRTLKQAIDTALAAGPLDPKKAAALNRRIMDVESNWLSPEGIPGRPWFKHMIYAARYTYAHLELPGITEAVEKQDSKTAREQTDRLVGALARNTALLRDALADLQGR